MKLTTVYTAQGHLVANMVKAKLESVGIPVLLEYESIGRVYGLIADGLGEVRVRVPEQFAEEAQALLVPEQGADDGG